MSSAAGRDDAAPEIDIRPLGDAAVVVTLGTGLSDDVNDRVIALASSLAADSPAAYVRDIVPALASLVVHIDPARARVEDVMERLRAKLFPVDDSRSAGPGIINREQFRIPVRYGGADGPDLADVAAFGGISADEVVRVHAAGVYRVYMLGFLPGFAYLGQVDSRIAAPRRAVPRQKVAAGAVGIAGLQTGVYPQDSPGGWQIIGRTTLQMFDRATGGSLLQPGDRVRFVPERA